MTYITIIKMKHSKLTNINSRSNGKYYKTCLNFTVLDGHFSLKFVSDSPKANCANPNMFLNALKCEK